MLQLLRCVLNRATTAVLIRTISLSVAAIAIAGASTAGASNDLPTDDTAVLAQTSEQFIAQHEPRSHSPTYAQLFWPFNQLFGSPAHAVRQRHNSNLPQELGERDRDQTDQRYIYIQSRDIFGNPGPTYRVLKVVRSKPKNRDLPEADKLKLEVDRKLRLAPPVPPTKGPLLLAVSIAKQTITLFDAGVAVYTSPVSTGTASHPTPTGVFSVVEKEWWHRSNIYSLAPMPMMQRITWSGIALHAGELPGYAASHGCVRLPYDFAVRLWGTTKIGGRVIITNDEVAPIEIAHARLFMPKAKAEPAPEPKPEYNIPPEQNTPPKKNLPSEDTPSSENAPAVPLRAQRKADQAPEIITSKRRTSGLVAPEPKLLTPAIDVGSGPRVIVVADAVAQRLAGHTAAGEDEAVENSEDDAVMQALRQVELIDPVNTVINGTVEIAIQRPGQPIETFLVSVEKMIDEADQIPAVAEPSVMLASLNESDVPIPDNAKSRTMFASQPAAPPVSAPERVLRPGPVSVLVSRKDHRMYVRKGFEPLFDVPITIGRPDQPIGTHVFTAVAVGDERGTARWMVVSLSSASSIVDSGDAVQTRQATDRTASTAKSTAAATSALDRLDLPQEAVERISELMSVGASLIVTDSGLGRDATALDSDFTILTR
jgi:lipoprotein-anchoring transpeptidase ErfK/SrfK